MVRLHRHHKYGILYLECTQPLATNMHDRRSKFKWLGIKRVRTSKASVATESVSSEV
jgi:hypothetical protein